LVTGVFGFIDVLIRFRGQKIKVTASGGITFRRWQFVEFHLVIARDYISSFELSHTVW